MLLHKSLIDYDGLLKNCVSIISTWFHLHGHFIPVQETHKKSQLQ